tara:strand:+ start:64 stop:309 length:246 start_codon:yes stop_codon:yes gene_type:complete
MGSVKTASQLGFNLPTIISGGESGFQKVELTEENVATVCCLIQKALIEKGASTENPIDYAIGNFTLEEIEAVEDIFSRIEV